jgi:hypothetical protein
VGQKGTLCELTLHEKKSVMTITTLSMAGIHQVSHEFLFVISILWNDLQDLQISPPWNFTAGGLIKTMSMSLRCQHHTSSKHGLQRSA